MRGSPATSPLCGAEKPYSGRFEATSFGESFATINVKGFIA